MIPRSVPDLLYHIKRAVVQRFVLAVALFLIPVNDLVMECSVRHEKGYCDTMTGSSPVDDSDIDKVMTSEEAMSFIRDILGVTSPKEKMATDPKSLLEEIVCSWQGTIPYQTVRSIATPHKERHRPTVLEIKNDIFAKYGGRCFHNNVGCYMVIRTLGFDVSLVPGDTLFFANSHVVMIVRNLSGEGSRHIADVGTGGWPTFRLIPLDFETESQEYHESFSYYKFVRRGDIIARLHKVDGDPAGAKYFKATIKDGWYTYADIHVDKPVQVSHFHERMDTLYTQVLDDVSLLTKIWCMAFPKGRLVCIKSTALIVEGQDGVMRKSRFKSRDEMLAAFARHFPQFTEDMVNAAIDDIHVKLDFNRK